MKPFARIISIITLICFVLTNVSFAQDTNSFKLSAPSSFSSIKEPEFKEATQIQVGIRAALKDAQGFSINSIKALGKRQFIEKSVFGKRIEGTIHFDETASCRIEGKQIYIEKGNFIFRANTKNGRTYYCLISKKAAAAWHEISVVSERMLAAELKKGIIKFTHESLDRKDRAIIALYLEHEITTENNEAIDPWIEDRMLRGEYAIDHITAQLPLYQHPSKKTYNFQNHQRLIDRISEYLIKAGVPQNNISLIAKRMFVPLVLISYRDKAELPTIKIGGENTPAYAHSSEFATYVFVPRQLFNKSAEDANWPADLYEYVEDKYRHEVGAFCGLKAALKNGELCNVLDDAVAAIKSGQAVPSSAELKNLSPVNLFNLELRNDYAAAGDADKKSIFKRAISLLVAAVVGAAPSMAKAESQMPIDTASQAEYVLESQKTGGIQLAQLIAQRSDLVKATNPYQFARKYSTQDIVRNPQQAEAFIQEYLGWEKNFYKKIRMSGIAMDGFNLKEDTLDPAQRRDWTAASKECLDLGVQVKILNGNKYGIQLTGQSSADAARREAINILKEKINAYEDYSRSFPGFGGFLPWITIRNGRIQPTSDWSDRLPALDNGEWVWSLYTTYHTLNNLGENDLAARYKRYFDMLAKNAPAIFYDTGLRKIRAEVKIRNPRDQSVKDSNYSNNIEGYYLDDCYEGMMMISFLTLFTNLPQSEKDHIWNDITMEKVTTKYGTTYKGWPPQSPIDGSPHIKWAFMFLPYADNPIARKVYILQEKIRTHMHK
jgi:hypothetical protein